VFFPGRFAWQEDVPVARTSVGVRRYTLEMERRGEPPGRHRWP